MESLRPATHPSSPPPASGSDKRCDPQLTDVQFERFSAHAYKLTGIVLSKDKKTLVFARLSKRLNALKLDSFEAYERFLTGPQGSKEETSFINAITTNLTRFFRESHHFDHIKNTVIPFLVQRYEANPCADYKRIRFWCAGCSSGEEPYSLAMMCAAHIPAYFDVKILATDIDTNMIQKAQAGIYKEVHDIPAAYQDYYIKDPGASQSYVMADTIRKLITFKPLNLLNPWPIQGPFQAVFCRNVVIYFNKDTQKMLFERMAPLIEPRGWLYIGHSESLFKVSHAFSTNGQTIYQKESST